MSDCLSIYGELETQVLAALREDLREEEFNALALEIHAFQRQWNEPYGRWCATQPAPSSWREIPAVPQEMFKQFRLACIPAEETRKIFRTSGTTGEARGEHHLRDTRLYEAAVLAGWRRLGLADHSGFFLTPTARDAPDSSLAHMFATIGPTHLHVPAANEARHLCSANWRLDEERLGLLLSDLRRADQPVALLGTALGFLSFFEWLGSRRITLAAGSYAMETGGFKGSGREIGKAELYGMFDDYLGLNPETVWNEYGMAELGSQFYTRGLDGVHEGGPWVRALVISPETGDEVAVGETGVLRIFDLANVSGALAIQTADLAIRREHGFILLGRDPGALPRGCSRMADEVRRESAAPRQRSAHHAPRAPIFSDGETTAARAEALATAAGRFPFLGPVTPDALLAHITAELGHPGALDHFVPYAGHWSRAIPPATILHIVSGNTPAAALQSLLRGLLLGSHNLCKLPSDGLPEVSEFLDALPANLRRRVEISTELHEAWLDAADAVIVFGSDETVAHFRQQTRPGQIFIAHGHEVSFGIIFDDPAFASVEGAASDASVFDQQGCLSPHLFYVREDGGFTARAYAERLSLAMAEFERSSPRAPLTVSEANAIRSLRDTLAFRAANGEPLELLTSASGTNWTVICDATPGFVFSPLNRTIFVKPLPSDLSTVLAKSAVNFSTCGIWPATTEHAEFARTLRVSRICPIGRMQLPPVAWHQDGSPTLSPLVRWLDFEPDAPR